MKIKTRIKFGERLDMQYIVVWRYEKEEEGGVLGEQQMLDRSRSPTESMGDLSWGFKIQI